MLVFLRPLKLFLAISSLPKIDSLAKAVDKFLNEFSLVPSFSRIISSTGLSFGGVSNVGGGTDILGGFSLSVCQSDACV